MTKTVYTRIQTKRDTSVNWEVNNPILLDGEEILVDTTNGETRRKIGDGSTTYRNLPFNDINIQQIIDTIYPIGSIYISVNETNPSILFSGGWEQIKDTFLLSAGDTYTAGSTGGEANHKLTTNEIPSHTHIATTASAGAHTHTVGCDTDAAKGSYCSSVHGASTGAESFKGMTSSSGAHTHNITVQSTGNSQSHNNMPPYLTVYMCGRGFHSL